MCVMLWLKAAQANPTLRVGALPDLDLTGKTLNYLHYHLHYISPSMRYLRALLLGLLHLLAQLPSTLGQPWLPGLTIGQTVESEEKHNLSHYHISQLPKGEYPLWGHSPDLSSRNQLMTQCQSSPLRLIIYNI